MFCYYQQQYQSVLDVDESVTDIIPEQGTEFGAWHSKQKVQYDL